MHQRKERVQGPSAVPPLLTVVQHLLTRRGGNLFDHFDRNGLARIHGFDVRDTWHKAGSSLGKCWLTCSSVNIKQLPNSSTALQRCACPSAVQCPRQVLVFSPLGYQLKIICGHDMSTSSSQRYPLMSPDIEFTTCWQRSKRHTKSNQLLAAKGVWVSQC